MNNSFFAMQSIPLEVEELEVRDDKPALRQKEIELTDIIKAIRSVAGNPDWLTLKEKIFDSLVENLEKRISTEAKRKPINDAEIYSLTGQLAWAKRFSDFAKLADAYKLELDNIKNQLK